MSKKGFGFSIGFDIESFQKNKKALDKMISQLRASFKRNFMDISNITRNALAGFGVALTGLTALTADLGSEMDALKTGFEGVWGSAEAANKQYDRLRHISENTDFGLQDLQKTDKMLAAIGYDAESSASIIMKLTNAAIATNTGSSKVAELSEQLLRIKVTGTVSARALKEFAAVGIEVDDLIGKSASEAVNTLVKRLDKFNGVASGESVDLWTQYSRAIAIGKDTLAELGNYINDNFHSYGVDLVNILDNARAAFKRWLFDGGIYDAVDALKDIGAAASLIAMPSIINLTKAMAPLALKTIAAASAVLLVAEAIHDLRTEGNLIKSFQNTVGAVFYNIVGKTHLFLNKMQLEFLQWTYNIVSAMANNTGLYDQFNPALEFLGKNIQETTKDIKTMKFEVKEVVDYLEDEAAESFKNLYDNSYVKSLVDKVKEAEDIDWFKPPKGLEEYENINIKAPKIIDRNDKEGGLNPLSPDYWAKLAGYNSAAAAAKDFKKKASDLWGAFKAGMKEQANPLQEWVRDFQENTFSQMGESLNKALWSGKNVIDDLGKSLHDLGNHILMQISRMIILSTIFKALGLNVGIPGNILNMPIKAINDAVISPKGDIITTHPDDYLIATKNPEKLAGAASGGSNVVVNVNNNTPALVSAKSSFDGVRTVVDLFIEGYNRNVNGIKSVIRSGA